MRHLTIMIVCLYFSIGVTKRAMASLDTIGQNGINSNGLTLFNSMTPLTGAGIDIGQVEPDRPGIFGFDSAGNSNSNVTPTAVTIQAGNSPTMNVHLGDGHATQVAGVMISTDNSDSSVPANGDAPRGIAVDANLYSSAYITAGINPGYQDALLTTQYVATVTPDMRAISHSWQKPRPTAGAPLDGNSQLTLGMDWSARAHDVLHVFAGNQGAMLPVPQDNYNGMTIGRSSKIGAVYRQVSMGNTYTEDAEGDRTSISMLAPGDNIELSDHGEGEIFRSGTSFAVPHVVGTVALLQEYGDERIAAGAANWNANARRHEVMKAVLMNSADKIQGVHGSQRTVIDQNGNDWFQSEAYNDTLGNGEIIALDDQMGAGHLNAGRALTQFEPGERNSDAANVPVIGWITDKQAASPGISESMSSASSFWETATSRSRWLGTG